MGLFCFGIKPVEGYNHNIIANGQRGKGGLWRSVHGNTVRNKYHTWEIVP
jgi:hypothetical protein